jgi:predicted CopG family antitoxin
MMADIMTSRYQITMNDDLRNQALEKAEREGMSFSEFVRRAIQKEVRDGQPKARVSDIFNLGSSSTPTDIANNKDEMLAEAIERDLRRR